MLTASLQLNTVKLSSCWMRNRCNKPEGKYAKQNWTYYKNNNVNYYFSLFLVKIYYFYYCEKKKKKKKKGKKLASKLMMENFNRSFTN